MSIKDRLPKNILPLTDEIFIALSLPLLRCLLTQKASIENEQSIFGFIIWIFATYFMFVLGVQCANKFYKSKLLKKLSKFKQCVLCTLVEHISMIVYCIYSILIIRLFAGSYMDINFYAISLFIVFCKMFLNISHKYIDLIRSNINKIVNR